MKMKRSREEKEEEGGFARLASFVCESEPFSEEQLQAIDATIQSSLPNNNKCPLNDDSHSPRRRRRRRRLPTSLIALQHPNASSPSPPQDSSKMRLPELKFSGQIMYSRTFDDVQSAITRLLKFLEEKKREMVQIAIGLDVEWRPTFQKGAPPNKVAVMQICGDASHCHVLHLIHSGIPQNLQLLLEDSSVLKVGVGIGEDVAKVFRDYNISIKGVEDLSFHANQKLGRGPHQWGLGSLTEKVLSKQLRKPKKIRMGNWESFLLSRGQLQYAATDAYASWYLYQAIKNLPEGQEVPDSSGQVDGVPQQ